MDIVVRNKQTYSQTRYSVELPVETQLKVERAGLIGFYLAVIGAPLALAARTAWKAHKK